MWAPPPWCPPSTQQAVPVPRGRLYLLGVEGGQVGAVHAPLGAQLQQVEQGAATQLGGHSEAQVGTADSAGTFVVQLPEDREVTPGRAQCPPHPWAQDPTS